MTTPLGTLGIINDGDRPCDRSIAVVVGHADGKDVCRYKCRDLHGDGLIITDTFTPLREFGRIMRSNADLSIRTMANPRGECTVTYADGRPRPWEGERRSCGK